MLAGCRRAWIARAITLVESTRADHRAAGAGAAGRADPRRRQRAAGRRSPACPASASRRSSTRSASTLTGAGHRVAVLAVDPSSTRTRRQHPRRQDPDGPARRRPGAFIRPVADRRHARRRRQGHPRGDGRGRGRRLRRGAGRDRRRRPVRDRPSPRWSTRSCCSPSPAPATSCRASRRASWSWPT